MLKTLGLSAVLLSAAAALPLQYAQAQNAPPPAAAAGAASAGGSTGSISGTANQPPLVSQSADATVAQPGGPAAHAAAGAGSR